MTWKQIETGREVRLWIGQVVVPVITLAATALAIPEVRSTIKEKTNDLKSRIQTKFKKKEES